MTTVSESGQHTGHGGFHHCLDHIIGKERIEGVVYIDWNLPKQPQEIFRLIKALKIRDDDIIVTGFPRSGNHWAYDVTHMIMNQNTKFVDKDMWFSQIEMKIGTDEGLEKDPSPRLLPTHTLPRMLPTEAIEKKTKIIYLMRNPKDSMVSFYHLFGKLKKEEGGFRITWDEFFDLYLKNELAYGTWFDHVLDMEKYMADHPKVPVYIHVFEEMKTNPIECIKNLSKFLEVEMSDSLAEQIAKATGFDNMKTKAKKFEDIEGKLFDSDDDKGGSSILRKGIIGDWIKDFDAKKNEVFEKVFREKMDGSKLASRVEKYTFL